MLLDKGDYMDKKAIAAQLYTLRDFLKTPEDIGKTLKRVKEIGYDAVQVSGVGPIESSRLKDMTDELDIKICVTHIPFERIKNDAEKVIQEHKLWGCKYVGLGAIPVEYRKSREGYEAFAREFSEMGKQYSDNGLQLVYHNHKFEFENFDGMTGMDIMLKESDPETFGFELDTYWVQAGGADPVEWIRKVEGRMGVVHFKDMAIKDDRQVFAEIGEGNLNWTAIIRACKDTGVEWCAVEQDVCQRDPFESLAMSLRFLEKLQASGRLTSIHAMNIMED